MSCEATCRMVGLDWGLASKHANAILIMETTPSATPFSGSGIRWSFTSFNNACWLICEHDKDEKKGTRTNGLKKQTERKTKTKKNSNSEGAENERKRKKARKQKKRGSKIRTTQNQRPPKRIGITIVFIPSSLKNQN